MATLSGKGNKQQVILAVSLLTVVAVLAAWEIRGAFSSPKSPVLARASSDASLHRRDKATASKDLGIAAFRLRTDLLARTEGVDYGSAARNLFSPYAAPVAIEAPLAPARPLAPAPAPAPVVRTEPTIDIRYLGFAKSEPGKMSALFMRGDDALIAHTGDIIFHRFRVGTIQEATVQVTDLASNTTQPIAVGAGN